MASVFIDHRRDDLHMGENHEKVTFLPKIKRKIRKSFKKIMDAFMILALHYVLENLLPKLGYLFILFLILFSPHYSCVFSLDSQSTAGLLVNFF